MTMLSDAQRKAGNDATISDNGCIRSFIIKSIQVIVQARSGNRFNSNCISDVGARNNMMIYLEDDPEIGATIKRTLQESGFSVEVGDRFCLDILTRRTPNEEHLVLMEVWQFQLHTSTSSVEGVKGPPMEGDEGHQSMLAEKSRLFERLGTLLKTVMVTTRLLPAYQYSRTSGLPLFYVVHRGDPDIDRLGSDVTRRQLGSLSAHCGTLTLMVHYRTRMIVSSPREMIFVSATATHGISDFIAVETGKAPYDLGSRIRKKEDHLNVKKRLERIVQPVKNAFIERQGDDAHLLEPPQEAEEENVEQEESPLLPSRIGDVTPGSTNGKPALICRQGYQHRDLDLDIPVVLDGTTEEMTRFFTEIRNTVELDLFHRGSSSPSDAGSLTEELERHETTLKEFDDFIVEFELEGSACIV